MFSLIRLLSIFIFIHLCNANGADFFCNPSVDAPLTWTMVSNETRRNVFYRFSTLKAQITDDFQQDYIFIAGDDMAGSHSLKWMDAATLKTYTIVEYFDDALLLAVANIGEDDVLKTDIVVYFTTTHTIATLTQRLLPHGERVWLRDFKHDRILHSVPNPRVLKDVVVGNFLDYETDIVVVSFWRRDGADSIYELIFYYSLSSSKDVVSYLVSGVSSEACPRLGVAPLLAYVPLSNGIGKDALLCFAEKTDTAPYGLIVKSIRFWKEPSTWHVHATVIDEEEFWFRETNTAMLLSYDNMRIRAFIRKNLLYDYVGLYKRGDSTLVYHMKTSRGDTVASDAVLLIELDHSFWPPVVDVTTADLDGDDQDEIILLTLDVTWIILKYVTLTPPTVAEPLVLSIATGEVALTADSKTFFMDAYEAPKYNGATEVRILYVDSQAVMVLVGTCGVQTTVAPDTTKALLSTSVGETSSASGVSNTVEDLTSSIVTVLVDAQTSTAAETGVPLTYILAGGGAVFVALLLCIACLFLCVVHRRRRRPRSGTNERRVRPEPIHGGSAELRDVNGGAPAARSRAGSRARRSRTNSRALGAAIGGVPLRRVRSSDVGVGAARAQADYDRVPSTGHERAPAAYENLQLKPRNVYDTVWTGANNLYDSPFSQLSQVDVSNAYDSPFSELSGGGARADSVSRQASQTMLPGPRRTRSRQGQGF